MPKRLLNGKQVFWSYCVMAVGALVVNKYYDAGGLGQLPPLVHWFYVVVFGFSVYGARYLFRGEQRIRALLDHGVFFLEYKRIETPRAAMSATRTQMGEISNEYQLLSIYK